MILHIATFRWKDDVTESDVTELTASLLRMAAEIPELRSYVVGPNLHLRPGGADYGVAAIVDGGHPETGAALLADQLPGDDVGVVLHRA